MLGGSRLTLTRLVSRRWPRALAALGAYLLALQVVGLPLLTIEPAASCCCSHRDQTQRCACKACSHARDVEANQPLLQTCAPTGQAALPVALEPFAPPLGAIRSLPIPRSAPLVTIQSAPPFLPDEVPTPPPLAQA